MIAYVTDVEGRWEKLKTFAEDNPAVALDGDRLILADGATFVFGGDAIDRGPAGRRVVATLLDAKRRYGDRVVLLAGNRDINKMRLRRELSGHPPDRAPEEVRGDRVRLLQWIFANTMGAKAAFEHRHSEIGPRAAPEEVVDSFLADLAPDGPMAEYLRSCVLAHRAGDTLFVHGGVTAENLGVVPDRPRLDGVDPWIRSLNAWYAEGVDAYSTNQIRDGIPGWSALIRYQAPIPGTRFNQASVVYGRTADAYNDPRLPEPAAIEALLREGIRRVVVGHTPSGDVPSVLRHGPFVQIMADNSYGRVEFGSRVLVGDTLRIAGRCRLDDERIVDVDWEVGDDGPVGLVTESGHLVKAPIGDEHLLFRNLPEYRTEQFAASLRGRALASPAPVV